MNAAAQVVRALGEEGASWAFGIPGTHNIELYDALGRSRVCEAFLVTDERSGAFMADAVSRTSAQVGVVNVVPGAGVTHCLSGVAEAFLDHVPLVVLACGIRSDSGRAFQLHDIDQAAILRTVTKAVFKPASAGEVYAAVRRAFALARSGCPGPVAVEIPAEYFLLSTLERSESFEPAAEEILGGSPEQLSQAAALLNEASRPMLYAGNGVRGACPELLALARKLSCPVATTIQGKGAFPESDRLWLWNGFGPSAPAFARRAAGEADALLAVGVRFAEVGTGSYGLRPPEALIHVDIDPSALGRNYPAQVAVSADAGAFLRGLLPLIRKREPDEAFLKELVAGHAALREQALRRRASGKVNPAAWFAALQARGGPDAVFVTDSGQGTFIAMEHLRLDGPGRFIGPIDFSCMGYSVPAAIGAKLAGPSRTVFAIAGDGAFLMTCSELLTASARGIAPIVCVLRDNELGQIAQFQRRALGKQTATSLVPYNLEALAGALGCAFLRCADDAAADETVRLAMDTACGGRPVVVELALDLSAQTHFAAGVVETNFARLPLKDKARLAARVAARKIF